MAKKLTYEFIKEEFEKQGITMLSTEYINAHSHLDYICEKHGNQSITWNNFKNGKRCPKCGDERTASKLKHSYDFVKSAFNDRGYELIETEYVSNDTPMRFICSNHGVQTMSLSNLLTGYGCNLCGVDSAKAKMKHSYDFIKSEFKRYGYRLMSNEYISSKHPLTFICPAHGEVTSTYGSLVNSNGNACLKCAAIKRSGENNGLWQGGITELSTHIRNIAVAQYHTDLIVSADYTCELTGTRGSALEVHHTYAFHRILQDTMTTLHLDIRQTIGEYTEDELRNIKDKFTELQASYESVVLSKSIHRLFYSIYGNKDFSVADFQEFKERYDSGEFTDILSKTA